MILDAKLCPDGVWRVPDRIDWDADAMREFVRRKMQEDFDNLTREAFGVWGNGTGTIGVDPDKESDQFSWKAYLHQHPRTGRMGKYWDVTGS